MYSHEDIQAMVAHLGSRAILSGCNWFLSKEQKAPKEFYLTVPPYLVEALRQHNVFQISSCYSSSCSPHFAVIVDDHPSGLRQSQKLSFNNKDHCDVVFMVEQEPIYAKTDILTQKSDYFAGMFRSNTRETINKVVGIPEDNF